jgi:hypothetical protein
MDYKISFEYKGIGKQASQARQKAIQAQKSAEKKAGTQAGSSQSLSINREFISSINKLIDSNKRLEAAVRRSAGMGGGGGKPGGGGGGGDSGGGGAAIGRAGSSLVGVGVITGIAGFIIQKVQQVANAYIEKTSQQKRSVGLGGFRYGAGLYDAAEMGSGMEAFAKSSGEFAHGRRTSGKRAEAGLTMARKVGQAYGLSAEETFGMAGTYERAGSKISTTAMVGRGLGIESEMPAFLQAIAGTMEEAISSGLDASELARTMDKNLASLTALTPGRSVQAAMGIIKAGQGAQQKSAKGKVGDYEGYYAFQTSKNLVAEKLKDKKFIKRLVKEGIFTEEETKDFEGADYDTISRKMGATDAEYLRRKVMAEADPGRVSLGIVGEMTKGQNAKERRAAFIRGQDQNMSFTEAQWNVANRHLDKRGREMPNWMMSKTEKMEGVKGVFKDMSRVEGSSVMFGSIRGNKRDEMIFKYGASFAQTSMEMERQMLKFAETSIPAVIEAMDLLKLAVTKTAEGASNIDKKVNDFKNQLREKYPFYKKFDDFANRIYE